MKKIRKDFNSAGRVHIKAKKSIERQFDHRSLLSKLDQYERLSMSKEQGNKIRQIRKTYQKHEHDKHANRAVRNRNYTMGLRSGIHLNSEPHKLLEADEIKDQKMRNRAGKESRSLYRNHGVKSIFKSQVDKTKGKEKE